MNHTEFTLRMHSHQSLLCKGSLIQLGIIPLFLVIIWMASSRKTVHVDTIEIAANSLQETQPKPPECPRCDYHRCNYEVIPYVHSELASAYLLLHSNYSFARFGDVDMELMQGVSWSTQNASKELSEALFRVLKNNESNMYLGLYDIFSPQSRTPTVHQNFLREYDKYRTFLLKHVDPNREYLSTTMSSPYFLNRNTSCLPVRRIYDILRSIWKGKDIVLLRGANGQVYAHDVYDTAKSQTVYFAPKKQAWYSYHELKQKLFNEDPRKLFILSAGPVAKVLALDLAMHGRRALDLGHLAKDYNIFMMNHTYKGNFFQD